MVAWKGRLTFLPNYLGVPHLGVLRSQLVSVTLMENEVHKMFDVNVSKESATKTGLVCGIPVATKIDFFHHWASDGMGRLPKS